MVDNDDNDNDNDNDGGGDGKCGRVAKDPISLPCLFR